MKNGKLFGKLNIIDLLIILIVLAALVFVGLRYFRPEDSTLTANSATPEKVRLTFLAERGPILLWDQGDRQMGSHVTNYDNKDKLGVLTSYVPQEVYSLTLDPTTGEVVRIPSITECSVTFTADGEGYLSEEGLRINGTLYYIGASYVIWVGQLRISCRLADFERIE